MSTNGIDVFDSSIQRTHIWLDEIIADLGPDRKLAWHALGAVLHAIRDRLPTELVAHLGAQLPLVVRGLLYDQWSPGADTRLARTSEAFLHQIDAAMKGARPVSALETASAVLRMLSRHVDAGQVQKVQRSLPEPVRELWLAAERKDALAHG